MSFFRLLAWSLITTAIVIAAIGGAGYWLYLDAERDGPLAEARTLVVPPHRGVMAIGGLLENKGVIRHRLAFVLVAKLSGRSHSLKPGEYEIPAWASAMQTLDILATGRTVKHRLTIPEGLTSAEVVTLVKKAPALDGDPGAVPPEGALLPDTYVYSYGDQRHELIERMRHSMAHTVAQLWHERRADLPLATPQEAVTLASIVEKETAREEERPHVAGVFINRLRLGMRLQADPTVLFALGDNGASKIDRPLTHADLAVASPYNTYLVRELPPGPIDNPGKASLRAAMRPEATDDLYFVADGSGGHVFAKTLAEQSHNIALYRHSAGPEPDPLPPLAPLAAPALQPQHSAAAETLAPPPAKPAKQASAAAHHHAKRVRPQAAKLARCRSATAHGCSR
ncbi:MAG: endolytic transglycosylase MltG [Thiohalocapsa sp.]